MPLSWQSYRCFQISASGYKSKYPFIHQVPKGVQCLVIVAETLASSAMKLVASTGVRSRDAPSSVAAGFIAVIGFVHQQTRRR